MNQLIAMISAWCYVGKRRLEKALNELDRSKVDVSISWHPFQLDPSLPRNGSVMKMERYKLKFGEERVKQMLPQMIETGRQDGIEFSFGGKIGSTFDSHRLLHYVKQQIDGEKKQNDLINILFRYSFEEEKDLSDHEVLINAAEQIGFNRNQIQEFLQSNEYVKEIQDQFHRNNQQGISGVPHFRINDRIELSGAQNPQEFLYAFQKAGIQL